MVNNKFNINWKSSEVESFSFALSRMNVIPFPKEHNAIWENNWVVKYFERRIEFGGSFMTIQASYETCEKFPTGFFYRYLRINGIDIWNLCPISIQFIITAVLRIQPKKSITTYASGWFFKLVQKAHVKSLKTW